MCIRDSRSGKQRPSNDLLYAWFIAQVQLVRKADVQEFDVWLRSEDGVKPYHLPNGLQSSIFPAGKYRSYNWPTAASLDWLVYEVNPKQWALTVAGHLELEKKVDKLPPSSYVSGTE